VQNYHSDWIYSGQILRDNNPTIYDHTFFNLSQEYKERMHEAIFYFLYRSNGGFTYQDVYNMPISIRTKYINMLENILEKQAQAASNKRNNF
jgi:hypothetical protein